MMTKMNADECVHGNEWINTQSSRKEERAKQREGGGGISERKKKAHIIQSLLIKTTDSRMRLCT